jgi:hypothetical protein
MVLTVLAVLVLAVAAVNLLHYRFRGGRFLYAPTGPIASVFVPLAIAVVVLSIFALLGIVSGAMAAASGALFAIGSGLYSVVCRSKLSSSRPPKVA